MEEGSNCLNPLGKMREDRREKRGKIEEGRWKRGAKEKMLGLRRRSLGGRRPASEKCLLASKLRALR